MKTTEELKNLLYKNETVADAAPDAIAAAQDFCEGYKTFLDNAKTEREATAYSEKLQAAHPSGDGQAAAGRRLQKVRPRREAGPRHQGLHHQPRKVRAGRDHRHEEPRGGLPPEHCPHRLPAPRPAPRARV